MLQRLVFANQLFSGFMGSRAFDVFSSARARSRSELCWAKFFRLFVHGKMFIYLLEKNGSLRKLAKKAEKPVKLAPGPQEAHLELPKRGVGLIHPE